MYLNGYQDFSTECSAIQLSKVVIRLDPTTLKTSPIPSSESEMSDSATADRKTKPVNFRQVILTREPKIGLAPLKPGRKRRSKEKRLYVCKVCPSWEETHLGNIITDVKVRHPLSSMSSGTRP